MRKSHFILGLCLLAFSITVQAQKKKKNISELEGKSYTIELSEIVPAEKKAPKPVNDVISFKGDKVRSGFMKEKFKCESLVYTYSVDTVLSEDRVVNFEANGNTEGGDEVNFTGAVTGSDVEGKIEISKKGKIKKEYNYTGSEKAGK